VTQQLVMRQSLETADAVYQAQCELLAATWRLFLAQTVYAEQPRHRDERMLQALLAGVGEDGCVRVSGSDREGRLFAGLRLVRVEDGVAVVGEAAGGVSGSGRSWCPASPMCGPRRPDGLSRLAED